MSSSISGRLEIILIVDMLLGVYRICVVHKFNLSGSGLSSSCLLLILHYSNLSLRRFVRRWLDIMRLWSLYLSIIDILENFHIQYSLSLELLDICSSQYLAYRGTVGGDKSCTKVFFSSE